MRNSLYWHSALLWAALLLVWLPLGTHASGLTIHDARVIELSEGDSPRRKVRIHLSWHNTWHNARNHDAAWLLAKVHYARGGYTHLKLAASGHQVLSYTGPTEAPTIRIPSDGTGAFVLPPKGYQGSISAVIILALDEAQFERIRLRGNTLQAHGLEMVYIPSGPFWLGDGQASTLPEYGVFHTADGNGGNAGPYQVNEEQSTLAVGTAKGQLYYTHPQPQYQGDAAGPVPASFPKGVQAFYVMKYETTQGTYAFFLNTISDNQLLDRVPLGTREYSSNRGSISLEGSTYIAASPSRPHNWFSWEDAMALCDFLALRPWTELEFTKAARGPGKPLAHEYPWATDNYNALQRIVDPADDELKWLAPAHEGLLSNDTRAQLGASYYWVFDLAGSVWERVITIGDSTGRAFLGSHGDGNIHYTGTATNADWPVGTHHETAGFGYRGGGYYQHGIPYTPFNPYSPIAYRQYGAWPGAMRAIAYSARFARTAEW